MFLITLIFLFILLFDKNYKLISLAITCSKPTINQATISPSTNPIGYNAEYTVSCNTGFKISGGEKMKCGASGFDQTPSCIGTLMSLIVGGA